MVTIITELSKYAMILSLAIYTVLGFRLVRRDEAGKKAALWQQNVLMFGMQFLGNLTLYLSTENEKILLFYIAQLGTFILFLVLQRVIYPNADQLLNHNMLLLLSVGLLMLARLSFDKAERQAELAALAAVLTFVIPVIIRKSGRLRNLYWLYGAAGFGLLAVVFIAGSITHGAKLSITVYGITLQPSELVKVLFVFFVAGGGFQTDRTDQRIGSSSCTAAGCVKRSGSGSDFLCDLSGHALCGIQTTSLFSGGIAGRKCGSLGSMEIVCPCADSCACLE